jgi:hypothetical protein
MVEAAPAGYQTLRGCPTRSDVRGTRGADKAARGCDGLRRGYAEPKEMGNAAYCAPLRVLRCSATMAYGCGCVRSFRDIIWRVPSES